MATIAIHLSAMPPSVNRIWRSDRGGRPHKSSEYKAWLTSAGWEAKTQIRGAKVSGFYKLAVQLKRPSGRRPDLDNVGFKAISDLLVSLGVVEDDSLCEMLSARWVTEGPIVSIVISPAGVE